MHDAGPDSFLSDPQAVSFRPIIRICGDGDWTFQPVRHGKADLKMFVWQISRLSSLGRVSRVRPAPARRAVGAIARKRRLSLHWFGHGLKRPFLAGILALVCIVPFSANAQSTVSGGLSIQMQVGSGSPTLGANPVSCTVGTIPLDFGKVTPGPRGLLTGRVLALGRVDVFCNPNANDFQATEVFVDYTVTSKHQRVPGEFRMTLNDADIPDGIFYAITGFLNDAGVPSGGGPGGTLRAGVRQIGGGGDVTSFDINGEVTGTTYPDGQVPSGPYRDTLTFALFF